FVVAGYGWVGRGVASRARGMGSHVIVTEVDPLRALEAVMDGFEVLSMDAAAKIGDIFCTATGDKHVIAREHMEQMKDGAILANTGHLNVEIDIPALKALAADTRHAREFVEEFTLSDGRRLYLVADGRLVKLAADEVHLVTNARFAPDFERWSLGRVRVHDDGTTSNDDRLGAIGDVAFVVDREGWDGEDVLVIAGDNLFDFSLARYADFWREKDGS